MIQPLFLKVFSLQLISFVFSSYLKDQGEDQAEIHYDVKYALRLCLGDGDEKAKPLLRRACVTIYTVMCLYEEAVSMALQVLPSMLATG